jgi:cyclopropane fatty-acyl-phospholipid synthase-like methyltransferase
MNEMDHDIDDPLGTRVPVGGPHYRAFVGPAEKFDLVSAMQFNLLTALGLREHHTLVDIGCGSLRAGRLFIVYLLQGNYFGVEPEEWLVREGIRREVGEQLISLKQPTFAYTHDFDVSRFGRNFDYLLAQSIFSHAAPWQIDRCLTEVRGVMTPDSIFTATYVRGEENHSGVDWVYPGCVTYTPEFMQGRAEEHGLRLHPLDWPHPNGQSWVAFTTSDSQRELPPLGGSAAH